MMWVALVWTSLGFNLSVKRVFLQITLMPCLLIALILFLFVKFFPYALADFAYHSLFFHKAK